MFFFGSFLYSIVLIVNAIAILSEDRFLARIGLSNKTYDNGFGQGPDTSVRAKLIALISSVRMLLRGPLILVNTFIILYELVLG